MFNFFKKKEQLGLLAPDPTDIRDYLLADIQADVKLPEVFDLRDTMLSIQRQFWGTCTAHAADGVKEYQEQVKLSQRFIYFNMKKISGLYTIQGDYIRNALKSVVEYGACLEADFPDNKNISWERYLAKEPSIKNYEDAEKYKGASYFRVARGVNSFKQAIFQNKTPVATGMMWFKSYRKPEFDGKLPLSSESLGGHAISCVGWDKTGLWFRNSHGTSYGKDGYFFIPYDEFDKHQIWDAWVLLDIKEKFLKGYCASNFLKKKAIPQFNIGDKATVTVPRLNLREDPNGKKVGMLVRSQEVEVIGKETIGANYRWVKIKTKVV